MLSTLIQEATLRPRLTVISSPRREVWVGVCLDMFVDITLCREVFRITPDVDRVRRLVHTDVVHTQMDGKGYMLEVDRAEVI